jgi:hypothetical protein
MSKTNKQFCIAIFLKNMALYLKYLADSIVNIYE